jgi:hypothetical protein
MDFSSIKNHFLQFKNHIKHPFTYGDREIFTSEKHPTAAKFGKAAAVGATVLLAIPTLLISVAVFYAITGIKKYKISQMQSKSPTADKTSQVANKKLSTTGAASSNATSTTPGASATPQPSQSPTKTGPTTLSSAAVQKLQNMRGANPHITTPPYQGQQQTGLPAGGAPQGGQVNPPQQGFPPQQGAPLQGFPPQQVQPQQVNPPQQGIQPQQQVNPLQHSPQGAPPQQRLPVQQGFPVQVPQGMPAITQGIDQFKKTIQQGVNTYYDQTVANQILNGLDQLAQQAKQQGKDAKWLQEKFDDFIGKMKYSLPGRGPQANKIRILFAQSFGIPKRQYARRSARHGHAPRVPQQGAPIQGTFNPFIHLQGLGIKAANSVAGIPLTNTLQSPTDYAKKMQVRDKTMNNLLGRPTNSQDYPVSVTNIANNPQGNLDQKGFETAKTVMSRVYLFKSNKSKNDINNPALFGSRDVLVTPCRMEYNGQWDNLPGKNTFHMLNAAAINVGENYPEDLQYYCKQGTYVEKTYYDRNGKLKHNCTGKLDEDAFIKGTSEIAENIFTTAKELKLQHIVLIPVGMGAFLRNLPKADSTYQDPNKMLQLRNKMAEAYAAQLQNQLWSTNMVIHLALPTSTQEAKENYDAFIQAVSKLDPAVRSRVIVYPDADASEIAQKLADQDQHGGGNFVGLVNGANKKLLGNRWFEDGAMFASDEGYHRRSQWSAFACALCNGTTTGLAHEYPQRQLGELEARINWWTQGSGQSHIFNLP